MNGKKARALRRITGHNVHADRTYFYQEHTLRRRQVKNLLGTVVSELATGTLMLVADKSSERVLYKVLKKSYATGRARL